MVALCASLRPVSHADVIKWKHFRVTGPLCEEFTVHRWIPRTKASDEELWFFFDLRLSEQSWGWWFEMPSRPWWRHSNEFAFLSYSTRQNKAIPGHLIPWMLLTREFSHMIIHRDYLMITGLFSNWHISIILTLRQTVTQRLSCTINFL